MHVFYLSFVLANARIVDYPIVYCNEAFSKLTGFSRVDIMQKSGTCALFYGENTTAEMKSQLYNALENSQQDQLEMLLYKKNRSQLWLMVAVSPVKNERDEVVLFLITFRDITALKVPFDDDETNRSEFSLLTISHFSQKT
ncbi:hypothetical protein Ciccas_009524 [Cichlidogyrus casuarinus]|uniref:LOV domain-containing protein n=1 Tax=Cichlidogyrus casuarinus TaxID=1844966 RepID=A0ABD2PYK0_9PLAT